MLRFTHRDCRRLIGRHRGLDSDRTSQAKHQLEIIISGLLHGEVTLGLFHRINHEAELTRPLIAKRFNKRLLK
jgi:hypothetical protein